MNENPSFPYPPSLPMSRSNVCVRIDIYFFRGLLEYIPRSFHTLLFLIKASCWSARLTTQSLVLRGHVASPAPDATKSVRRDCSPIVMAIIITAAAAMPCRSCCAE